MSNSLEPWSTRIDTISGRGQLLDARGDVIATFTDPRDLDKIFSDKAELQTDLAEAEHYITELQDELETLKQ